MEVEFLEKLHYHLVWILPTFFPFLLVWAASIPQNSDSKSDRISDFRWRLVRFVFSLIVYVLNYWPNHSRINFEQPRATEVFVVIFGFLAFAIYQFLSDIYRPPPIVHKNWKRGLSE